MRILSYIVSFFLIYNSILFPNETITIGDSYFSADITRDKYIHDMYKIRNMY